MPNVTRPVVGTVTVTSNDGMLADGYVAVTVGADNAEKYAGDARFEFAIGAYCVMSWSS